MKKRVLIVIAILCVLTANIDKPKIKKVYRDSFKTEIEYIVKG